MRNMALVLLLAVLSLTVGAQKRSYNSYREASLAENILKGESGPEGVEWIEKGNLFSFTKKNGAKQQIWTNNLETQTEELVFDENGFTFPGIDDPFIYHSFQWTRDYQYLLFQTNFRPIWRYSGNADYYYY